MVESYGTWLLLQRLVDASKDSDIPKNVPFAFAINNRYTQQPSRTIYSSICVRSRLRARLPTHTPRPHTGFPMSARLSRLRLFQRHLRSLVWVWVGIGFTLTLLFARAPLLLATLLSYTIPFPDVN